MDSQELRIKDVIREGLVSYEQSQYMKVVKAMGNPYASLEEMTLDHAALNSATELLYKNLLDRGFLNGLLRPAV